MPMRQCDGVPKISVLMGVLYRGADAALLQRSVGSILAQTYGDFELLICDDGSSSEAVAYLNHISGLDRRVRLIRPGRSFALPEKLNECLRFARGRYIARMDDDDYSHPERFDRQIRALENAPSEIGFVGSSVNLVRGGAPAGVWIFPEYPSVRDFYITQPFIHPALMFRGEALMNVGGYSEAGRCLLCEDYDLLLRFYEKGCVRCKLRGNF